MKPYLILLFIITGLKPVIGQNYEVEKYQLVPNYSDEFSSSTLNSQQNGGSNPLWYNPDYSGNYYNETAHTYFHKDWVSCATSSAADPTNTSGFLRLTSSIQNTPEPTSNTPKFNNTLYAGGITTMPYYRYGYYETRIKLAGHANDDDLYVTSAWWLAGGHNPPYNLSTYYNEIDIIETSVHNILKDGLHVGTANGKYYDYETATFLSGIDPNGGYVDPNANLDACGPTLSANLNTSFHTVGMEWMPDHISFYFDGNLVRRITKLAFNPTQPAAENTYGTPASTSILNAQSRVLFWLGRASYVSGGQIYTGYTDCSSSQNHVNQSTAPVLNSDVMEVDYFRYYKAKPQIQIANYVSGANTLTFTAQSPDPSDTYSWNVSSGNMTVTSQSNGSVTLNIPVSYTTSQLNIVAKGPFPSYTEAGAPSGTEVSSTTSYSVVKSSGGICSLTLLTPTIFIAPSIVAPMSGCSSTIISAGSTAMFVADTDITLNPGFEVQLGATFDAFVQ